MKKHTFYRILGMDGFSFRWLRAFLVAFLIFTLLSIFSATAEDETGDEAEKEEKNVDVRVTELRARISPQLEIVLPSGNIYEHFVTNFNNLEIAFNLSFSVLGNTLGGDITFAYPMNVLSPSLSFYQQLDFENYFQPAISGSDLTLVPTSKYIMRKRGFTLGLSYEVLRDFHLVPAFSVSDIFKGSLTENRVLEDGVDIIPQMGFVYDSVRAEDTERKPIFTGLYAETIFDVRYRNEFRNPIEVNNRNHLLLSHNWRRTWFFEERATLTYPVTIWDKERASFYSLGGFHTVRGYEEESIHALRFFLFSLNMEREILNDREVRLKLFKRQVRMHQYRIFFLFDSLFTQDRLSLEAPVDYYSSTGMGVAFSLSGRQRTHFQLRFSAAQPLTERFAPIIYFRTSLFHFETQL